LCEGPSAAHASGARLPSTPGQRLKLPVRSRRRQPRCCVG
jgi:hypothetical protein